MKKLILPLIFIFAGHLTFAQTTNIPDPSFEQALIDKNLDDKLDGKVLTAKISNIKVLFIQGKNINSLKGIEDFKNLEELYVSNNALVDLDITKNTKLVRLFCSNNKIKKLDVSQNKGLEELNFMINQVSSIDLSQNKKLRGLNCMENSLTVLDLSVNKELFFIDCSSNKLDALDVTFCLKLNNLHIGLNPIKSINLTNNEQLLGITMSGTLIESLDLSRNFDLAALHCNNSQIRSLDLSANTKLYNLRCDNNHKLTCLNLQGLDLDNKHFFLAVRNSPSLSCIDIDSKYLGKIRTETKKFYYDDVNVFTNNCYSTCKVLPDSLLPTIYNVYPNPLTSKTLSIDLGTEQQNIVVEIKNQYGIVIKNIQIGTGTNFTIDFEFPPGVYFVETTYGNGIVEVARVMKFANRF